jgi:hypothetical protein
MIYTLIGILFVYLFAKIFRKIEYKINLKIARNKPKKAKAKTAPNIEEELVLYGAKAKNFIKSDIENSPTNNYELTFKYVVDAFSNGRQNEIMSISSRILSIRDEAALKALATHFDDFRCMVANLPIEKSYGSDYRFTSLRVSNLLGEISRGHCRCNSYNSGNSFSPPDAEKQGLIKVLETQKEEKTIR